MELDDNIIKLLPIPSNGRTEIADTRLPGFYLRINAKGGKHWSVIVYKRGNQRRHSLGRWPIIDSDMAYKKALRILRKAAR